MEQTLPYLKIDYRPDLDIVFCRWTDRVSSEELQAGYRQVLKKAKVLQTNYWLFDLRRRGPACPESEAWLLQEFFPLIEATISGNHYFAYLVTPSHYTHICEGVGLLTIEEYSPRTKIHAFDSEQKAISWLIDTCQNPAQKE